MLWDGLGFFGFDDTKLDRIKGKEVTWFTPMQSLKSTPLVIIGIVVMTYIIFKEAVNLGK